MAADKSPVEIGYLEKCESWKLESRFFPSKVGGKPAWLDLSDISLDISCGTCSKPCIFLCQLYAPVPEQSNAYHRTIYIFICKDPECCKVNNTNNFKVFRCQLPQINNFYSSEEPKGDPDWCPDNKTDRFVHTCFVCGCFGSHQCSKCSVLKYCSREHQILHWKSGHQATCGTDNQESTNLNILFPEYEIITEPEIIDEDHDGGNDGNKSEDSKKAEKSDEEKLKEYEQLLKEGKGGTLKDVPPEMIEQFALGSEDKYFKYFKSRLSICPDQVVRYDKGGQPLWIAKPDLNESDIPNCEICQGPREFEFQVLSTLLNYLNVDSLDKSIDWGTLLIYTCKSNCEDGPAYKKEFLWKQDIS